MIIIVLFGALIIIKFLMETPVPFEFMEIVTRDTYEAWIGYYATEKECLRELEARIRKSLMRSAASVQGNCQKGSTDGIFPKINPKMSVPLKWGTFTRYYKCRIIDMWKGKM